jgi:hypothetical protein
MEELQGEQLAASLETLREIVETSVREPRG